MSPVRRFPTFAAAVVFLAACSSSPRPTTPAPEAAPAAAPAAAAPAAPAAPAAAPDLSGDWEVRLLTTGQGTLTSMLRLVSRGGAYAGNMAPLTEGTRPAFVRSVTLGTPRITIMMEWEGEEARIDAVRRGPDLLEGSFTSRSITGRITLRRR